ncbi:uncharacterized protein BJ212DRAFT_1480320 [Suillus subaureus]|uniref:Uncharacterized protein n=1 Tax=Suillus subaureus TaxID=48587 RepID=A0A9P7EBP6_9AGAM|nr:uncharacterized protein BJ212DRAFT_1480320 [Suillus subaureus]KAG1817081.1 hypothetical protein BJ212DRAFT_1480320 [Suillus subaureus]
MSPVEDNKHPVSQVRVVHRYLTTNLSAATQNRGHTIMDVVSLLRRKGISASVWKSLFTVTLGGQAIVLFSLFRCTAILCECTRSGSQVMARISSDTRAAVLANFIGVLLRNAFAACTPEDNDTTMASTPILKVWQLAGAGAVLLGSDLRRGVLAMLEIVIAVQIHTDHSRGASSLWCFPYHSSWFTPLEMPIVLPVVVIGFGLGFGLGVGWAWRISHLGMRGYNQSAYTFVVAHPPYNMGDAG